MAIQEPGPELSEARLPSGLQIVRTRPFHRRFVNRLPYVCRRNFERGSSVLNQNVKNQLRHHRNSTLATPPDCSRISNEVGQIVPSENRSSATNYLMTDSLLVSRFCSWSPLHSAFPTACHKDTGRGYSLSRYGRRVFIFGRIYLNSMFRPHVSVDLDTPERH